MVKRRASVVLGLVLLAAAFAAFALAGQTRANGSTSVLAVLAGRVELAHGPAAYAVATDGELVIAGDRVRTDAAGHAVVTFFDGSTLEIAPTTEITVSAASSRDGSVDLVIVQAIGRTFSSVHKLVDPRSRYEIQTPSITAVVRGTKFEVEVAADGSAAERTTEGLVAVSSAGIQVLVPAGSETRATPGSVPAAPAAIPPAPTTPAPTISPAPTASPAVITTAPPLTPTQAPVSPSSPSPSTSTEGSAPAPRSPRPAPVSAAPAITNAPVPAPATLVPPTLLPLPTTTLAPLPAATLAPLPSASIAPLPPVTTAPLPSVTVAPLPSVSIAPLTTVTVTPPPTVTVAPLPIASDTPLPSVTTAPTTSLSPSPSIGLPVTTVP